MLKDLVAHVRCSKCGLAAPDLRKADRQYGLAVKLEVTCSVCEHRVERFSSPRTEGSGNITSFDVNMRDLKSIQSIGKGVTALLYFCAGMNLSHRGLHHKTFQAYLREVVQVCEDSAAASEADSVRAVEDLYSDLGQPPNSIDVMFDGTWMTRGWSSHIGVGCITEVYTGLVIDDVVLSNFCLGCAIRPKASDEGYEDWLAGHEGQRNIDCGAGRMEVEAALIMFKRSLSKSGLRYTTVMSDGDSRTMHGLKEEGVYGLKKKDCITCVQAYAHCPAKCMRETNESIAAGLGYTASSCLLRRSLEKDKKRLKKSTTAFLSNGTSKRRLAKRHKADRSTDYSPGQL
ncbi:hypothetical protein HPB48_013562 [Haemaphysalis longicornis]|uniref:Mutator-like transposase domain-containing protein n=1 Tax=Haemaphysalis longicornis TaxID=44386 RepID=A0A9J6GXK2_HAELO|nr:hypothetical protein HPB48_013562 [Haemaphysalis longicornis]